MLEARFCWCQCKGAVNTLLGGSMYHFALTTPLFLCLLQEDRGLGENLNSLAVSASVGDMQNVGTNNWSIGHVLNTKSRLHSDMTATGHMYLKRISSPHSMWQLSSQRGRDGVEVELLAAIVYWHLAPFAMTVHIAITLQQGKHHCTAAFIPANMMLTLFHDKVLACLEKAL